MTRPATAMVLLLTMHSWSPALTDKPLAFSRKVMVSNSTLFASKSLSAFSVPPIASFFLWCSQKCDFWAGCRLWCDSAATSECLVSDMIVMPGYREENLADALPCYTLKPKDLAAGAKVMVPPSSETKGNRTTRNLVDGIYDFQISQCTFLEHGDYLWVKLGFEAPVSFRFL